MLTIHEKTLERTPTVAPESIVFNRQYLRRLLITFLAYRATDFLTYRLPFGDAGSIPIWFPTGVALFFFLYWGKRVWPAVLLGCLSFPISAATLRYSLANTAEPLLSAFVLLHWFKFSRSKSSVNRLIGVIAVGGVLVPAVFGAVWAFVEQFRGVSGHWASSWMDWALGDFSAVVVVTPLLLSAMQSPLQRVRSRVLEATIAFAGLVCATVGVFAVSRALETGTSYLSFAFLVFPFFFWIAIRFGVFWSSLTMLFSSLMAMWQTASGKGPFVGITMGYRTAWMHIFIAISGITLVILSAAAEDKEATTEALRDSEQKYRFLFEVNPRPMWIFDRDTLAFVEVNEAALNQYGYSKEEFLRLTVRDIRTPAEVPRLLNSIAEKNDGLISAGEWKHIRKDGSEIVVEINGFCFLLGGRHLEVIVASDITASKQAQERLRNSEQLYRNIVETAEEGIWIVDGSRKTRYSNRKLQEMLAYSEGELQGQDPLDLIDTSQVSSARHLFDQPGSATHSPREMLFRTKNGASLWAVVHVSGLDDGTGKPTGSLLMVSDITPRKEAYLALAESAGALRSLVNNAPYGICRTSGRGKFLEVNPVLFRMLQYDSAEELMRFQLPDIFASDLDYERVMAQAVSPLELQAEEVLWKTKSGSHLRVRISCARVRFGSAGYCEFFVEDLSHRDKLEQQLRQAQKMEAIGRLAGGIAHDFNNLLNVISGYGELLSASGVLNSKSLGYVDKMVAATGRAASLTGQLLAFSRKQVLLPAVVDLNTAATELGKMLPRLIGEDIDLVIQTAPESPRIKVDPTQLEQVILNLVVNARDAMPQGGTLIIAVERQRVPEEHVEADFVIPAGAYGILSVTDNGIGMNEETKANIFEPFFTTKDLGKGTGLGLSTVYGIVKQSGGYILVESQLGAGSSFRIYLPEVEESSTVSCDHPSLRRTRVEGSGTILLVEDDASLREATRDYLVGSGYRVLEADSGPSAIQLVASSGERIDILVSDLVLPKLGGWELARRLRVSQPDIKILIVSGYAQGFDSEASPEVESVFLKKPYSFYELGAALQSLLKPSSTAP